jgi:aspartate aminotransferase
MSILSKKVELLGESETLAMARLSRELKEKGLDVINMSLGEPDFDTPEFIKEAAIDAIRKNYSHYTPVAGYKDLLEAVCHKLKRDNQLSYSPSNIVVSTGAKQSIANAVFALVSEGDEVILPVPYWVSYKEMVAYAGGSPVLLEAGIEKNFKPSAADLENSITPKTKLIIFSSPCNPTGSVWTDDELQGWAEVIERNPNVFIISDEIYELINFGKPSRSLASFDTIKDRVITVNGLSKGFAMTGWRLGYLAAHETIAAACTKIQGQYTSATCSITQRAAIAALMADPEEATGFMRDAFKKRRDLALHLLNDIPGMKTNLPDGAFYIFPEVSAYFGKMGHGNKIENSKDLCMYLIHEAHVAITPGGAFGMDNHIRISYAASEQDIEKAITRIKGALAKLG